MKSIICFGILLSLIFPLYNVQKKDVLSVGGISEVYFVKNKDGKQYYEKQDIVNLSCNSMSNIDGLILIFEDVDLIETCNKLQAEIVKEEKIDGMKILYGYTSMYSDFIYVDGKQVNVQLVRNQEKVIAGLPIIFSGF